MKKVVLTLIVGGLFVLLFLGISFAKRGHGGYGGHGSMMRDGSCCDGQRYYHHNYEHSYNHSYNHNNNQNSSDNLNYKHNYRHNYRNEVQSSGDRESQ